MVSPCSLLLFVYGGKNADSVVPCCDVSHHAISPHWSTARMASDNDVFHHFPPRLLGVRMFWGACSFSSQHSGELKSLKNISTMNNERPLIECHVHGTVSPGATHASQCL